MQKCSGPIGVFDSGIGGLTVFAEIRKALPDDSIIYLGDTARVPYGTKSAETIIRYSRECAAFLIDRNVRAIVVACNTASSYALQDLKDRFDVPILGVIEPGAGAAVKESKNKVIGVIGTTATISSNAYGNALKALDSRIRVVSRACPLFVPLVEEGWTDNEVTFAAAKRYLGDMQKEGIDTLILGCTHYPLLATVIAEILGENMKLVDSAKTTAEVLKCMLLKSDVEGKAANHIYVTDLPSRFETIARRFLGGDLPPVTRVDL